MAISYSWDCKTCDTYPTKSGKSNVVYNVHWTLTATDDTNKDSDGNNLIARSYGTQNLNTDDLSSFKNWSSLTNSDVQGWVETALTADTVTAMKASLDSNISQQITPSSVTKTLSG
tara:strand:+ start:100 stop:447 length:348 start_codon:yes stop_codon:yes gene_type:complete